MKYYKKTFIIPMLLLFWSSALYSMEQNDGEHQYYTDLSSNLIVKPYIAFTAAYYSINYNDVNGDPEKITYSVQEKETDGIFFSWHDVGFSAGISRVTASEYKGTKNEISYDFRVNYLGRKFCYDLYFMKQDGLFLNNGKKNSDGTLPYYSSVDFMTVSANFYYIFSSESFSLRAAYESTDKQNRSAGTFLFMLSSGIITVKDNSSLLREEFNSVQEDMKGLKKCRTEYFTAAPGYSRTFVFYDNFFFNFLSFLGIGAERTVYSADAGKIPEHEFYPRADCRFSLGYSSEKYFFGVSLNLDVQKVSTGGAPGTSLGIYDSKFYAGYRFLI